VFAGQNWQPQSIERVTRVIDTSTKPISAVTDDGTAIVKYIGNPQGLEALICELVGTELANCIGLQTPDFAVADIPNLELPGHPLLQVASGPAFFSRWEEAVSLSPKSGLLQKLRRSEDLAKLVVLDTWTRNKDRFSEEGVEGYGIVNFDNVLLRRDKRKVELLVIDHTHAFIETTLDDELGQAWIDEQKVYGLFQQFEPFLTRKSIDDALTAVNKIDLEVIEGICEEVPRAWGMTQALANRLSSCIFERGSKLGTWLPSALFDQYEMNLFQREGA
jgi:hypothetical protein